MALNLRPPTGYDGQMATTHKAGILRIATDIEASAGVSTVTAITPAQLSTYTTANLSAPPSIGNVTPASGAFTLLTSTGATTLASGVGAHLGLGSTTSAIGFFGATGATRVTQGAITNSVTSGGTTGTIADYSSLSVYATDAATIRNNIYQLSLALANVTAALRSYGLLV